MKGRRIITNKIMLGKNFYYQEDNLLCDGIKIENIVKKYYDQRDNDVLVEYKTCAILKELGPLPAHFFHKSRRTSTGLQYTCIAYGKAYSKYRNRYRDIMNQPDSPTKDLELRMLGDWKQAAYNEAKNEVQKDLQAEVEAQKIFG